MGSIAYPEISLRRDAPSPRAGLDLVAARRVHTPDGGGLDLLAPDVAEISGEHIAFNLGRIARYTGGSTGPSPWTVGEHSVLTAYLIGRHAPAALRLAALLHDGHEAYTTDVTTPMKEALRQVCPQALEALHAIQDGIQAKIHEKFGLPWPLAPEWEAAIKRVDTLAVVIEREHVLVSGTEPWSAALPAVPERFRLSSGYRLPRMDHEQATATFLAALNGLVRETRAEAQVDAAAEATEAGSEMRP